jgi:hypothetical protein
MGKWDSDFNFLLSKFLLLPLTMINQITFTLLEATVRLFAVDASGNPGSEIWSGQVAERLHCGEQWITVETRPTGARYPRQHPLVPQYKITIGRLWALPLSDLIGFQPTAGSYVLDVVWTEEETQQWHRRTFYGVTIAARTLEPPSIESGHVDDQEFAAQYFVPSSGSVATAVPAAPAAAYTVLWVGTDGSRPLYVYDPAAKTFTETNPGDAASRAPIAADGSVIQFSGVDPSVTATADGLTLTGIHDVFPAVYPRLEFWYGAQLVAAVTAEGLWARSLADGTLPGVVAGQFQLQHGGTTVALLGVGLAQALAFNVTT